VFFLLHYYYIIVGMQPLHLYGGTDGSWEVKPPALKLQAPAPPEPTPGINIWRDTMERHKWLQKSCCALRCMAHEDFWLRYFIYDSYRMVFDYFAN